MASEKKMKKEATTKKKTSSADTKVEKTTTKKVATKTTTEKATTKKAASKKTTTTKTSTKKVATKSTASKTSSTRKTTSTKNALVSKKAVPLSFLPEYYDLPYRYNQTIVRILAQTPTTLFVYWDIADEDRETYKTTYGENFFEITKPVLIIHNKTKDYYFEVEVNDFANSWYLHVGDSDCVYEIELGRRPNSHVESTLPDNFLHVAYSNPLETPNDHILANTVGNTIIFKDTKSNHVFAESIVSLPVMKHLRPIYPIYDIYEKLYKEDLQGMKLRDNPSSSSFLG